MAKKYIDADELLNEVLGTMFSMSMCLSEQAWRGMKHAQQIFARMIETAPAADVVEVKRGKWEEVEVTEYETAQLMVASMRCPVCNRYHNEVYHYGNPTEMAHYCGICGAKMEVTDDV